MAACVTLGALKSEVLILFCMYVLENLLVYMCTHGSGACRDQKMAVDHLELEEQVVSQTQVFLSASEG